MNIWLRHLTKQHNHFLFFHSHGYSLYRHSDYCFVHTIQYLEYFYSYHRLLKRSQDNCLIPSKFADLWCRIKVSLLFVLNCLIAFRSSKVIIIGSEILPHLFPTLYSLYLVKKKKYSRANTSAGPFNLLIRDSICLKWGSNSTTVTARWTVCPNTQKQRRLRSQAKGLCAFSSTDGRK